MKRKYEIGYGRPPKASRFQPGQSGNPRGRPRGLRSFKSDVKATLETTVRITRNGKPHRISTQKAFLLRLKEQGLRGNGRALDRYIQLAQIYNNDELPASGTLSADDATILEFYNARILSGVADLNAGPPAGNAASKPEVANDDPVTTNAPARPRKGSLPRYVPKLGKEATKP